MVDGTVKFLIDYDTKQAQKSNEALANSNDNITKKNANMKKQLLGTGTAIIGATTGVIASFMAMSNSIDDIAKSAKGLNSSIEGYQGMQFAADKAGISSGELDTTLKMVGRSLVDNKQKYAELGIEIANQNGELKTTDEVLKEVLVATNGMNEEQKLATLNSLGLAKSFETMNKIGADTNAFLGDMEKGMENAISAEDAKKFEALNDKITDFKLEIQQALMQVASFVIDNKELFAVLGALALALGVAMVATALFGTIITIATSPITLITLGIMAAIAMITALYVKFEWFRVGVNAILEFLKSIFMNAFNTFFTQIDLFINSIGEMANAIFRIFGGIIDFVAGVFTGDWEQAWNGVKNIFGGIWDGLVALAKAPLNFIISMINGVLGGINGLTGVINKIPGVDIGEIPKIPSLSIGTNYVKSDGIAEIHKGEAIVPANVVENGFKAPNTNGNNSSGIVLNLDLSNSVIPDKFEDKIVNKIDVLFAEKGLV